MNLTERKIEQLRVEPGRKDMLVFDDVQRGLAVRVSAAGGRNYIAQYTLNGRKWRVPLGACAAISLAAAREAAAAVLGDVAKGRNPAADRKAAAAAETERRSRDRLTLRVLIDDWRRLHLPRRRPRYAAEAVRALHYAFEAHLDRPAEALDRPAVVRALDDRARAQSKVRVGTKAPGAAIGARTAAYGRAAFSWAVRRGSVATNPFIDLPFAASEARERVLADEELGLVWRAACNTHAPYGQIVQLLILTGQRRDEVSGMAWPELTPDLATWTIPRERTKNSVPHIVPLPAAAAALLRALLPEEPEEAKRALEKWRAQRRLVLAGNSGKQFAGWSKAKSALDRKIAEVKAAEECPISVEPWRLHDLRRTLATGLQRLGTRLEVTEAVLNHVSGSRSGIVGVYQRHDWAAEKRVALDAWARHVLDIAEQGTLRENVVSVSFGFGNKRS